MARKLSSDLKSMGRSTPKVSSKPKTSKASSLGKSKTTGRKSK